MIPGLNHTITYRDLKIHFQTEDGGEKNPIIVSHAFLGGRVITSKRSDYSHLLITKDPELKKKIKKQMQDQHRAIMKEVVEGGYDKDLCLEPLKER